MLRTHYLEQMKSTISLPLVKVLIGLRRIGKTTLLQQIQQEFKRKNPLTINFELLEFEHLLEYHRLHDFLEEGIQG